MNIKNVLLVFVLAAVVLGVTFITEFLEQITGVATVQTATVSVNISLPPTPARFVGGGAHPGAGSTARSGMRVEPTDFLRAFSLSIEAGTWQQRQFYIKNTGDVTFGARVSSTLAVISFDRTSVRIRPGEEVAITYTITTNEPGIYTGRISVESEFERREIPVAISIKSSANTFNVYIEAKELIAAGEDLALRVRIVRALGGVVALRYLIKDANNRAIVRVSERRAIENSAVFEKRIPIPHNLRSGTYVLAVEASYRGKTDVASQTITVSRIKKVGAEKPQQIVASRNQLVMFGVIFLVVLIVVNLLILRRSRSKL